MKTILLIDDDPVVSCVYETLFQLAGYDVKFAGVGEAGLAAVHRHRPDAVLLDLDIPRLNGMQWLNSVRAESAFRMLPIVVLAAGLVSWQVSAIHNSDQTIVLSKSETQPEHIVAAVGNALLGNKWQLMVENATRH